MEIIKKRILAKFYYFKIHFKSFFQSKKNNFESSSIQKIIEKYATKEKIIVVCSGPSVNKLKISSKNLYLVTNSAYDLVKNEDCLYYINDGFFVKKILSEGHFLKANQELVFFYYEGAANLTDQDYLLKNIDLLKGKDKFFISQKVDLTNYNSFIDFYKNKGLPIKIQNSGVFLMLFGYLLSKKMNIPLEIYGLDLGIGGSIHYDNKGVVGNSVIKDRVKDNVKMYLTYMYEHKKDFVNHSNFFPSNTKK